MVIMIDTNFLKKSRPIAIEAKTHIDPTIYAEGDFPTVYDDHGLCVKYVRVAPDKEIIPQLWVIFSFGYEECQTYPAMDR
jgi:hypothetical protein